MKRGILLFATICLLSMSVWALAGEVTIVDRKDVETELVSVETKEISFKAGETEFTIPITKISTIHLAKDGETLILRAVTGKELRGTSDSELKGTWELGTYSIALSKIKSVDFGRTIQAEQDASVQALAGEVTIVDRKDVETELASVETKEISFKAGETEFTIPITKISTIHLAEDGETLILRAVTGKELRGTSDSELKGTWELGTCSIALSKIRSVDFGRAIQAGQAMTMESQPNGFFVTCTDWAGMTTEVFGFSYNFGYGYPTPGWIGRWSHDEDNPRMYLPFEYKEIVVGIPFADIDEIGFTDEPLWINITLRDENVLKGELGELGEDSQRFTGKTEYGDFSLRVEKVRQVAFDHTQDKNAPRVRPDLNLTSAYTMSIKTWQGNQFILLNGCRSELKDNYQWTKMRNSFDVKIGESTNNVSFDKIKRIQFREKDKDEAQLTTTSGKTIDISLSRYIWLGGNLDPFGPARIKMSQVASFEISRTTQS